MTNHQKNVIAVLLKGGSIANTASSGFRLRDEKHCVVAKIRFGSFQTLRKLLRRQKGLYVLNRNAVRQLHGGSWIKKEYKNAFNQQHES